MKKWTVFLFPAALLMLALPGCGELDIAKENAESPTLSDGVYLVIREETKKDALGTAAPEEKVIVHHRRYAASPQTDPPTFLLIRLKPFVPLCLASRPREVNPGTDRASILLEFSQESGLELERLTRTWTGSRAAVIIGGKVITVHKIREAIKGGRLQVSCCAEGAREYLLKHLDDNF